MTEHRDRVKEQFGDLSKQSATMRSDLEKAAEELLHRRRARTSLLDYITYVMPTFQIGKHHRLIATKLEQLAVGKIKRLIIEAPPRHSKSSVASIHFPAWFLGCYPEKQIIVATHSADYSADIGRQVRNLVGGEESPRIFPELALAADSKAADRWHTTKGGVFLGAGVGSSIMGRGAHCFVSGTMVSTISGKIPIEEIRCGDVVLTHEGRWRTVTSTISRLYSGWMLTLKTAKQRITCTPEHRFRVHGVSSYAHHGWKAAESIRPYEQLFVHYDKEDFIAVPLKSKKAFLPDAKIVVYDLTVEEDHSFLADNFVVHNCVLIDDPIKSIEDADSKLMRERLWAWYQSALYTRLMPGGVICLIATRWSFDDLTGRLLDAQDKNPQADKWEVISLPALAEDGDMLGRRPGEPLWPEWFPLETLEKVRETISTQEGPRFWQALYQQRPVEESGTHIRKAWFKYYDKEVAVHIQAAIAHTGSYFRIYGASDYAVTGEGGDFTVHIVVGVDPQGDIYILDLWRQQTTSDEWVEAVVDMMEKWKPMCWAEESGQIAKSIGPYLQRRMNERHVYCRREQFPSHADKVARIRSISARASMGKIYLPESATWVGNFLFELTRFPAGMNDDQVDAFSLVGRMMDTMHTGDAPVVPKSDEPPATTYGDLWKRHMKARKTGIVNREAPVIKPW